MKNATLMVSLLGNRIYLGTLKKNAPFPVMNDSKIDFTDKAIRAVAEHMMSMKDGECYEFPGHGKLIWQKEKPKATDSTESAKAEGGSRETT